MGVGPSKGIVWGKVWVKMLLICNNGLIKPKKDLRGGGCEIRTHGEVAPSLVFKTSAIDHSANPPKF